MQTNNTDIFGYIGVSFILVIVFMILHKTYVIRKCEIGYKYLISTIVLSICYTIYGVSVKLIPIYIPSIALLSASTILTSIKVYRKICCRDNAQDNTIDSV